MSIATQISRIKGLRDDLTGILYGKGIVSSGTHTLEEDVVALENFTPSGYNLQTKTVELGQDHPGDVAPDLGYDGLSSVSFIRKNTEVAAGYIKYGHTIMGVPGLANIINNFRKLSWTVNIYSYPYPSSLTLQSADASCFPNGSFTPGNAFPVDFEQPSTFMIYVRRNSSYLTNWEPTRKEVLFLLYTYASGYGPLANQVTARTYYNDRDLNYLITGASLTWDGTSTNSISFTLTPTPSSNCIFYGVYNIELIY